MWMLRCGFLLLLLISQTSQADSAADSCAEPLCWQVSPIVCVADKIEQGCQAELRVIWFSDTPRTVCLYLAEQAERCWQQATSGQWQQQINWQQGWLSLRQQQQVLLSTELLVLSRQPAKRRRISGAWSIF
ncbi:DUF3019 domain-containing protein [Arsukibacterium sp.]|uniref:DUF3019 domain-containing protein n=1 Tax=Arsukibacterium sp. TaxID=1977258 RepID=UPI00299F01C8|nr:DUF3019 domain-containing protein [Arsukibacterium sp.]MDX1677168.1 DUF3019 domain-containing protein [Arsukibacterium sp.]